MLTLKFTIGLLRRDRQFIVANDTLESSVDLHSLGSDCEIWVIVQKHHNGGNADSFLYYARTFMRRPSLGGDRILSKGIVTPTVEGALEMFLRDIR